MTFDGHVTTTSREPRGEGNRARQLNIRQRCRSRRRRSDRRVERRDGKGTSEVGGAIDPENGRSEPTKPPPHSRPTTQSPDQTGTTDLGLEGRETPRRWPIALASSVSQSRLALSFSQGQAMWDRLRLAVCSCTFAPNQIARHIVLLPCVWERRLVRSGISEGASHWISAACGLPDAA
jgi:hypothetical protein